VPNGLSDKTQLGGQACSTTPVHSQVAFEKRHQISLFGHSQGRMMSLCGNLETFWNIL
jgi:hypothetical protein